MKNVSAESGAHVRKLTKRTAALWFGLLWLSLVAPNVAAQLASTPGRQQAGPAPSTSNDLPYVNSGGLRLRDFPSTNEGKILATLDKGRRLEIGAVTEWRVRIGGSAFPWYHVTVANRPNLIGWVYGEFVSFEPGYPLASQTVLSVSRQQMNRPLLVLQMFRLLLGTDSRKVATHWLQGLPEARSFPPQIAFPTAYSLRSYRTDFGGFVVRFHPQDAQQLVLSLTLDRPASRLILRVGDPVSRVKALLGSNYYSQGQALFYRGIPEIGNYAVTIQTKNGLVTSINASALVN